MSNKPIRVFPYDPYDQRTNAGLNNVSYGPGNAILQPGTLGLGTQDSDNLNIYVEKDGDHHSAFKRSGATQIYNFAPSGGVGGTPLGLTIFNGVPFGVVQDSSAGDTLIFPPGQPNSGTTGTSWTNTSNGAWSARTFPIAVVFNNQLIIIGGQSATTNDVWGTYDGVTWTQLSSIPFGFRFGYGGCVYNGTIYVMGGLLAGNYVSDVWSSTDAVNWTQITTAAPWTGRQLHSVVATTSGIVVMGGAGNTGGLNDVWLSVDGINWNQATAAAGWAVRSGAMAWWFNNTLIIGGGQNNAGAAYNDVWGSTNGGVSWTQLNGAAFSGGGFKFGAAAVYNNKLWMFGGRTSADVRTANIYTSPTGSSWTNIGSMISATDQHAVAVFQVPATVNAGRYKTLWIMGGQTPGGVTNATYRATLDTALTNQYALVSPVQGTPYDFASFGGSTQLLIKSSTALFIADQGGVRRVQDSNYPFVTARGIVVLGAFVHVMDSGGLIHSSALNTADIWPPLNVLGDSYDDDQAIGIAKVGNYLVAWGTKSMEVYYDAGNPTGSPLSPYEAASTKIGCYSGATIQWFDKYVIWLGQNPEGLRQVYMLDGLTPQVISTPAIDKIIQQGFAPTSYTADFVTGSGHEFYLLNIVAAGLTLVYDIQTKQWTRWQWAPQTNLGNGFQTYGSAAQIANTGQSSWFFDANCKVSALGSVNQDYGFNYYVVLQTEKYDGGNDYNKYWGPLVVVGDTCPATPTIFFTDDDYRTWSAGRTVDMSTNRPILFRNGRSRRRAITYIQLDNNTMGIEYFEFPQVEQGGDAGQ